MWTTLYALCALALLTATILPLTDVRHWLVRANDFPRLQYSVLLVLLLVVLLVWRGDGAPSPLWGLPLLAALAYQLHWIGPYSGVHREELRVASIAEQRERPRLKLLTSNVLMDNRDPSRLIDLVLARRPDLLVTLESDAFWQSHLDDALGDWPHRVACALDNRYGMHLYSRLPLDEAHVDFMVEDDVPSISARLTVDGLPVRFHAIHPTPPAPGENPRSTERDVELLTLADALTDSNERILVTGDLNDVAWSRTTQLFRRRSRLLDPRVGRGMFNTFHADHWFMRWPLDHVFLSGHFTLVSIERLPHVGSDHFPVLVDLVVLEHEEQDGHLDLSDIDHELEADTRASDVARHARAPSVVTPSDRADTASFAS